MRLSEAKIAIGKAAIRALKDMFHNLYVSDLKDAELTQKIDDGFASLKHFEQVMLERAERNLREQG